MRDETSPGGTAFATFVKSSRAAAGMTQDDVLDRARELAGEGEEPLLSKSTLNRWEQSKNNIAQPAQFRLFCQITGADPREGAVALGFLTREELDLPPAAPPLDPVLLSAAKLLANQDISVGAKESLRKMMADFVQFTYDSLQVRRPKKTTTERRPARR